MDFERKTGSILAVDVGSVTTRVVLFDRVDGSYRFVSRGVASTTAGAPWNDVSEGIREAIQGITSATARQLLDEGEFLVIPEGENRTGVDHIVSSTSAGRPLKAILVGLTQDVSLDSGRRAVQDTYIQIEDVLSLADDRPREQQVDAILALDPDLIIMVGGTDSGATQAMIEQIRTVALSCSLIESGKKPQILFAGNPAIQSEVGKQIGEELDVTVTYADNVRPHLAVEQLDGARAKLAAIFRRFKMSRTGGMDALGDWGGNGVIPTAKAFGRIVHFMGQRGEENVLGIDIGSTSSVVAATKGSKSFLNVFGQMGIGHHASAVLEHIVVEDLMRWLVSDVDDANDAIDYVLNKTAYPTTVPHSPEELDFELALAREIMHVALSQAREQWEGLSADGPLPHFDKIVAGGGVLGNVPHLGYSALAILDALQPGGIVELLLDADGVTAALGSVAELEPAAAIEVLDSGGLVSLGTAICPVGRARRGKVVVRAELVPEGDDPPLTAKVRYGSIELLPLQPGLRATLKLRPRGVSIGSSRRTRTIEVVGGALGVIIDARGRPLNLPRKPGAIRSRMVEWRDMMLSGSGLP